MGKQSVYFSLTSSQALLHSAVYRLPRILKCIFTLAFDTDFDTANSFPLKMGCFPKAHEHHV